MYQAFHVHHQTLDALTDDSLACLFSQSGAYQFDERCSAQITKVETEKRWPRRLHQTIDDRNQTEYLRLTHLLLTLCGQQNSVPLISN